MSTEYCRAVLQPDHLEEAVMKRHLKLRTTRQSLRVAIAAAAVIAALLVLASAVSGATAPTTRILDTSLVGNFAEPAGSGTDHAGKSYTDHNYWKFCAAGAARVVLAFTGKNSHWVMHKPPNDYFYWPLTSYTEPTTSGVRVTTSWKDGTYADQGRGYMMFLAEQVNPPRRSPHRDSSPSPRRSVATVRA